MNFLIHACAGQYMFWLLQNIKSKELTPARLLVEQEHKRFLELNEGEL